MSAVSLNKNTILIGVAIVGVIIVGVLIFSNSNGSFSLEEVLGMSFGLSNDDVGKKAVDYINNNGLSSTPVSLVSVSSESGLVKIKIKVGENEFDSYATKDGKLLFPSSFKMEDVEGGETNNTTSEGGKTAEEILASIKKSDKPALEAYIVSRCPFGLQMQRMVAEAFKTLPELKNYVNIKYMGTVSSDGKSITAMHGDAEAKENLRQICIRDEQASKYWDYVSCQMEATGTETSCEKSTGVDSAKLNACMSDPSRGVAYAKEDFAGQDKYGVDGSPTLVLGEAQIAEFDSNSAPVFGGRTADAIKEIVCAAFNTKPSFCSTKLNTSSAATSFSVNYASSSSSNSSANCE